MADDTPPYERPKQGALGRLGEYFYFGSSSSSARYRSLPKNETDRTPSDTKILTNELKVVHKFWSLLSDKTTLDSSVVRDALWNGCPDYDPRVRSIVWKLILGYLPFKPENRAQELHSKRVEYSRICNQFSEDFDQTHLSQIKRDIPRTVVFQQIPSLSTPRITKLMERALLNYAMTLGT
jgi:hypothetical protein